MAWYGMVFIDISNIASLYSHGHFHSTTITFLNDLKVNIGKSCSPLWKNSSYVQVLSSLSHDVPCHNEVYPVGTHI